MVHLGANESDDQQQVLLCLIVISWRFSAQFATTTSQFTLSERNGLVYKPQPRFLAQNLSKKVRLIHESLWYMNQQATNSNRHTPWKGWLWLSDSIQWQIYMETNIELQTYSRLTKLVHWIVYAKCNISFLWVIKSWQRHRHQHTLYM